MSLSIRIGCFIIILIKISQQQLVNECSTTTTTGRSIEILEIPTPNGSDIFEVYCELTELDEQPWLVIFQRKVSEYEYGRWRDYKQGYNTLSGNYFIGLSRLHAITRRQPHELAAQLINAEGVQHYLHFDEFAINNESNNYSITQRGNYVGSMPLVQLKDWLPWHSHSQAMIPHMKIAIRSVKRTNKVRLEKNEEKALSNAKKMQ